jgi:hypothetical protein
MLSTFVFVFSVPVGQVGWSVIPYLLGWGFGVRGAIGEKLVSKAVNENGDGLNV